MEGTNKGNPEYFERDLIVASIHDDNLRRYIIDKVSEDIFSSWYCREIYKAITRLHNDSKPVSFVSVYELLRRRPDIDNFDEIDNFLSKYMDQEEDINFAAYTNRVLPVVEQEVSERVTLDALSRGYELLNKNRPKDVYTIMKEAERNIKFRSQEILDFWEDFEKHGLSTLPERGGGVPTGFYGLNPDTTEKTWLDDYIYFNGIGYGQIAVWAGESGIGKTTELLNLAVSASLAGYEVDFYSGEMPLEYINARTMSIISNVPTFHLENRSEEVYELLMDVKEAFPNKKKINFRKFPAYYLSVEDIYHDIDFEIKKGRQPDLIIIDYMDLMEMPKIYKDHRMNLGALTSLLRDLGQDLGCAVATASQIGREGWGKKDVTPALIAESILKITNSDLVFVTTREILKQNDSHGAAREVAQLYVGKNRFGKHGLKLIFNELDRSTGRFFNPLRPAA